MLLTAQICQRIARFAVTAHEPPARVADRAVSTVAHAVALLHACPKRLQRLFASPLIRLLSLHTFLSTFFGSVLYFYKQQLLQAVESSIVGRTSIRAQLNMAVGLGSLLVQVFGTGRLMALLGPHRTLLVVPLATVGLFALLQWATPSAWLLLAYLTMRRVACNALDRPSRESFFTMASAEERSASKALVDTFIVRTGDAAAATAFGLFARPDDALDSAASAFRGACLVFAGLWVGCVARLGMEYRAAQHAGATPSSALSGKLKAGVCLDGVQQPFA